MKFKYISIFIVFCTLSLFASNTPIPKEIKVKFPFDFDSASHILEVKKKSNNYDSVFFKTYQNLIRELIPKSPFKAILATNDCLEYANKLKLDVEIRDLYHLLGTIYWKQGVNDRALEYFQNSLNLSLKMKEYEATAYCYSDIGNIFYAQSQYQEAMQIYWKGINIVKNNLKENKINEMVYVILYDNIGLCYGRLNKQNEAIKYFKNALAYAIKNDFYTNIAITYRYIGNQYTSTKDFKNAIDNLTFSISYFQMVNLPDQMAETYQKLGLCYSTFGYYDKALEFHFNSKKLLQSLGYSKDLTEDELNISKIYFAQDKFHLALKSANMGLYLSKVDGLLNNQQDFCLLISQIYEKLNDNKQALYYYKEYYEVSNKIFNTNVANKTASLKFKMDIDNKNQEILLYKANDELKTKTTFYLILILIIITVVVVILFVLYTDKNSTSKKLYESEQKLSELNIAKDRFFTIIAHDLKSPISALMNIIEMMVESYESFEKEEMIGILGQMSKSSKSVYNLLENLLLWSRIQTGRTVYNPDLVDLNFIINENISLLLLNAKEKSIELVNNLNTNINVLCDIGMIQTVIRNLISNAIKFTNENGKININLSESKEFYILSIADSGVGMNQESVDKLFRIDVNHSTLGTKNEKGTGLGLIICKDFVELNGGTIWVESTEGLGSTFSFSIPKI